MNVMSATVEQVSGKLFLVPLLPLFGAVILSFLLKSSKRMHSFAGPIATLAAASSFVCVCMLFLELNSVSSVLVAKAWTWFDVHGVKADFSFRFDNLASVMALVVTGVGSLIHLYAIGYMKDDENRPRFFCYLNLFLFSMLLLVLGDNLLVMFIGWEGVGLCSYLLIGFWFKEMDNAKAGQKAFIVNRIGDAGFLLGILTLFIVVGSVNFVEINSVVNGLNPAIVSLIALLLFVGAVGKSAQIPLFVWLPDAMAGPTPVSALIHAATMVTAGVYLLTRLSVLYAAAPFVLSIIAVLGTLTALLAATIALVQTDIKRVLAYSTVSQLGYMFMALGAGAFSNGIYHVVTHAFFKACLFMAAGSVIVGCHHEQDMRQFGGLWRKMPWTFFAYFVATLAIAGFPLLSGFYSKDQILWTVYSSDITLFNTPLNKFCWGIGVFTAFLTAFYMTRSLVLTFFGQYRGHSHPHESPRTITVPLFILALLSAVFAFIWGEDLMHYLGTWTRSDIRLGHEELVKNPAYHSLETISIIVAISGILLAALFYTKLQWVPQKLSQGLPQIYNFLCRKWLIDELYSAVVVKPLRALSNVLFKVIDRVLIDGAFVEGSAICVEANGEIWRRIQTGQTRFYAVAMFVSASFLILFYLLF